MNRRTWVVVCLALLLALSVTLSAAAQEKKGLLAGQRLGFIFSLWDVGDAAAEDGSSWLPLNGGLGLKYWVGGKSAVRAVLDIEHFFDGNLDVAQTFLGLSAAFEYHFKTGKVSPYTGGLAGVRLESNGATDVAVALGALLGVEVKLLDFLGLYGEYSLQARFNEPDTWLELGAGNGGSIGLIVYLP